MIVPNIQCNSKTPDSVGQWLKLPMIVWSNEPNLRLLLQAGLTIEQIAQQTGIDLEVIRRVVGG